MRTLSALRAPAPTREAVERLSDRALRAAAANPDHSEAARAAIEDAMRARRITPAPWRAAVRGFLRAEDLAHAEGTLRQWPWRAALVALARLSALAGVALWLCASFGRPPVHAVWAGAAGAVAVAALFAWLLLVAFRTRPARLLYHGGGEEGPLRAMIRNELRIFGNTVRMAAPDAPMVRTAADYRALARRMRSRVRLNLATALAAREALPIDAAAPWKGLTLQLIANSSDALIVDLSDGTAALDDLRLEAAAGRCVFVTLWGRIDAAEAALAAAGVTSPCFFYAPDGEMQRRTQFRAAVIAAMRATHRVPA